MIPVAIHIFRNSPKRPKAKLSIYAQRYRQGISWKMFGVAGAIMRHSSFDRVYWVRFMGSRHKIG